VTLLLLFDIDGTLLLKATREHAESLHAALKRVYHLHEPFGRVEAAGRTDGAIARSILLQAGVDADRIDAHMPDVRRISCEEYARRCPPDLSDHLAPGMGPVLAKLAGVRGLQLSLVTGNLEPIARLKLERAGIAHHFPSGQGGFGSDDDDRAALPEIARRRAGDDGRPYPRGKTIVIGDTPRDIACARADGVRVIAIATGPFAADQLQDADAVIHSARELPGALKALLAPA
jgi:phosphoglycolate phosphatase-like HAD superfamily hydrolase